MSAAGKVKVRPAMPGDVPSLVEFNRNLALETEGLTLDEARLESGVRAVVGSPDRGFYLVAEAGRCVVGCLLITSEWSDWRNGWFWWLQSVYVRADARRRGVFSALHRAVRTLAQKRGDVCGLRLYVCRDNVRARKAYARIGMARSRYEVFEMILRRQGKRTAAANPRSCSADPAAGVRKG